MPHIDSYKKTRQTQLGVLPGEAVAVGYAKDAPESSSVLVGYEPPSPFMPARALGLARWEYFDMRLSKKDRQFENRWRCEECVKFGEGYRQRIYRFPNGIEVSVINDGYGSERGRYEIWSSDKPDVEGRMLPHQVVQRLRQAKARKGGTLRGFEGG